MKRPFGWLLPVLAVIATGLAIWADPTSSLALAMAMAAVAAAGLVFVEIGLRAWLADRPISPSARHEVPFSADLRFSFRSGRLGREAILALVDQLERLGGNPALPARALHEVEQFVELEPSEFRAELSRRLDELEGRLG